MGKGQYRFGQSHEFGSHIRGSKETNSTTKNGPHITEGRSFGFTEPLNLEGMIVLIDLGTANDKLTFTYRDTPVMSASLGGEKTETERA